MERRQHHQNQVQSHKQQSQNQIHTQYHRDNLHSTKQIQLQPQSYGQSHQHARYNSIPHIYHSNPSPQQTIYMNYHSQQQRQTNNNYNMLQYNNIINKNTGLSLDAQIRAHHNDMDSDEGTESESESSSDAATDFIDSESNSDTISSSESHSDTDSDTETDSKISSIYSNSKQTYKSSSHKQSSVWNRTYTPIDLKIDSKTQYNDLFFFILNNSSNTISEDTHDLCHNITPDITPRASVILQDTYVDTYIPNIAVIYDDKISMTNSKSLIRDQSKSKNSPATHSSRSKSNTLTLKRVPHNNDDNRDDKKQQIASHLLVSSRDCSKSKKSIVLLKYALKREILFIGVMDKMIDKMVEKMYCINVEKGKYIKQNEIGNAYFVVENGNFVILKSGKMVGKIGAKSAFGEGSLLYSIPRSATLKALQDSIVWALDANEFKKIRQKLAYKKMSKAKKKVKFLRKIKLFNKLDIQDVMDISQAMKPIMFRKNRQIITEGEKSTHFYIIYSGKCKVYKKNKKICEYNHCDCFGDNGIMNNKLSDFTVIAKNDVICYVLNAMEFKKVLNAIHCRQSFEGYTQIKLGEKFKNNIKTNLFDLSTVEIIGNGTFGEILLVEDSNTNKIYALKKIRKNKIISTNQKKHSRNERAILASLNSKFCVQLYGIYNDNLYVYLLMEAVLGGELFYLLKINKKFPEKTARFYASCVILAFEHIHSLNVIFRALKPEHMLINKNGYIKLIDFGYSKIRNSSCTLCGKLEYLAPEMIQCSYQSFAIDWWTLGIFIYEMIYGCVPFKDDPNVKMYEKILSAAPIFPQNIKLSRDGLHFIQSLLRKHPSKRLGSGIYPFGVQTIKKHAWFNKKFNWNKMKKQLITPPYIPNIENGKDIYDWCDEF